MDLTSIPQYTEHGCTFTYAVGERKVGELAIIGSQLRSVRVFDTATANECTRVKAIAALEYERLLDPKLRRVIMWSRHAPLSNEEIESALGATSDADIEKCASMLQEDGVEFTLPATFLLEASPAKRRRGFILSRIR